MLLNAAFLLLAIGAKLFAFLLAPRINNVRYFPAIGQLHQLKRIVAAVAEFAAQVEFIRSPDAG